MRRQPVAPPEPFVEPRTAAGPQENRRALSSVGMLEIRGALVAPLISRGEELRRLAAFVHADMVGYSRLVGNDDVGTFARLSQLRQMVIEPTMLRYGGQVVNTAGDSLLMEFTSVIAAVRFAVDVQEQIPRFDDESDPSGKIRFRMGINAGDAIPDGSNLHGDSVNIAVRLQSACPPGGVCVSAMVRDHVQDRLGVEFVHLGKLKLKNIARPIEAFVVRIDGCANTRAWNWRQARRAVVSVSAALLVAGAVVRSVFPFQGPLRVTARPASILVLPIRDVSNDAAQQYLADAVTSDIATDLSRIRDIVVISPATAFTFKGKFVDPERINHDMGVRYLVSANIRRVGQRVNTGVELIDAASGVQLWGDRFSNDFVDLEKLEEGITGRIAASLNVQVVNVEGQRAARATNPDALDLRLRATSLFYQSVTPENTLAARNLLIEAVRLDPNSAEAWGRLAELTASDYLNHWNNTGPAQLGDAEEALRRALLIDPNLALAHFANGLIQRARGEHYLALEAFNRVLDLDASFTYAYAQKADELILTGRPDEAEPLVARAISLSPRDPSLGVCYWFIGRADFVMGRYDRAIPWLRKSVELRPNVWYNLLYLASAYALNHDLDSSRRTLQEFQRRFPGGPYTLALVSLYERSNPDDNPSIVAARAQFHRGLHLAGMPAE